MTTSELSKSLDHYVKAISQHAEALERRQEELLTLVATLRDQLEAARDGNPTPSFSDKEAEEWLAKEYPDEDPCPYSEWPQSVKDQYDNRKESDK
jgi:hypothetical protein